MATFTVKRSEWYRGQGSKDSKLLREDGKRCCIGFVGQQVGFTDEQLLNMSSVQQQAAKNSDIEKWPAWMKGYHLTSADKEMWPAWMKRHYLTSADKEIQSAYLTNDCMPLTDAERETSLQEIFKRNGDEIVFVD
jgi:hypothetical protein